MKILGTRNFGAYARKVLIDGYIIKVDYSEQRKLAAEVNKIGVNINQICKRINSPDRVYSEDVAELRKRMDEVRKLLFKAVDAKILNPRPQEQTGYGLDNFFTIAQQIKRAFRINNIKLPMMLKSKRTGTQYNPQR